MATNFDITFIVVSLIIVFVQYLCLYFSPVWYMSRFLILCDSSVRVIRYVLSLFNCYITWEKSDFNPCNIVATLCWNNREESKFNLTNQLSCAYILTCFDWINLLTLVPAYFRNSIVRPNVSVTRDTTYSLYRQFCNLCTMLFFSSYLCRWQSVLSFP